MSQPVVSVPRPRIQGLSDLIFGLALSIGAIQLVGNPPKDAAGLNIDLLAFGFSFLILINLWNRYTTLMQVVPVETLTMTRLNILLLFLVAIEPFLFNLLNSPIVNLPETASSYYGVDIAGMNFVLAYFAHILTGPEKKLVTAAQAARFKINRNGFLAVGILFAISAMPLKEFWIWTVLSLPLRIFLWIFTVPIIWASRLLSKQA